MIKSIDITGNHIEDIKAEIDDICSFKEQHFHPSSATKIKLAIKDNLYINGHKKEIWICHNFKKNASFKQGIWRYLNNICR